VNFLIFSESDLPLAKGLRHEHHVVTAWPRSKGVADISYDAGAESYDDIRRKMPFGFKPAAIILVNLEYVNFVWGLQETDAPVFALISDSNLCFDVFRAALGFVDVFVCNEEEQRDKLLALGSQAIYLPWFSVDSDVFYHRKDALLWDVSFVGNLNPYIHRRRGKLLEKLLSAKKRFETRVLTDLHGEAYAKALSRGKIVFNHAIRGELNMRVFEALGLGRLLLVEESNKEVLRYFEAGRHLVVYNEENILDVIEYYLKHASEREAIAQAGHEEALAKHTSFKKGSALAEAIHGMLGQCVEKRQALPLDVLYRGAARIFLQHGQLNAALEHADRAVKASDSPENRLQRARVIGTVAYFVSQGRKELLERFQAATESAMEANPKSTLARFNRIELMSFVGEVEPQEVRGFIDNLEKARVELDVEGGPIQVVYDPFRVAWEELLYRGAESPQEFVDSKKKLLLARACEILGDEERIRGRPALSLEAYSASLQYRENGYVRQKLGSTESQVGKVDAARQSLSKAFMEEPFFFAARKDLASVELNAIRGEEARRVAEDALDIIVKPFRSVEGQFLEVLDHTSIPGTLEAYSHKIPIFWQGLVFNTSGYARETSLLLDELLRRGLPITIDVLDHREGLATLDPQFIKRLESAEGNPPMGDFVHVFHFFAPNLIPKKEGAVRTICRTTYETDKVPSEWLPVLQEMDQVWVMSEFNRRVFIEDGIRPERIAVIPSPLGEFPRGRAEPLEILNKRAFNFLSVFEWGTGRGLRKAPDILLRAFFSEFTREDDVSLVLRVYAIDGQPQIGFRDWAREFVRKELGLDSDKTPPVLVIDEMLTWREMQGLYEAVDAFVLPSRGEGFGRPYLEALTSGLPTIATRWGGHLDFLTDENAYLIDIEGLEEVPRDATPFGGHRWAKPSVEHLRKLLRRVYEDPEEGRRKASSGISAVLARHNVRNVANLVTRELNRLFS